MNILALDDENLALEGMVKKLHKLCPDDDVSGFLFVEEAISYAKERTVDVAFLDIEMYDVNGIKVAKMLKEINRNVNIIFTTGYREYMEDAFSLYASGYILKPVTENAIKEQLQNLRYPVNSQKKIVEIKTFGKFEIFVNDLPLKFGYNKTKELFAILVDKEGRMCSVGELMSVLWEDDDDIVSHTSYMRNLQSDLLKVLKKNGIEDVVIKQKGSAGIDTSKVKCDLYDFKAGVDSAKAAFHGEYMTQYSWAEYRIPMLEEEKCLK